ncbi:hypothetical protein MMC07_008145 [Pseudocyphellaria aurata]|nr:hypothetical protein [Pseudocyphellaria aurata]
MPDFNNVASIASPEGRPIIEGDIKSATPPNQNHMIRGQPEEFISTQVNEVKANTLYDSIIYAKVGPDNTSFGIHRGLLCHHSSYFDRALNGNFREAVEGEVVLADEDPSLFARFNEWLYTGVFLLNNEIGQDIPFEILVDLYVFAEKRGVIRLQNAVIDCMIKKRSIPTDIRYAWNNTPDSSPLHKLLVDLFVRRVKFAETMDDAKKRKRLDCVLDKDILIAYVMAFHRMKADGSILKGYSFWESRCLYHVHNDRIPPCEPDLADV